MEKETATHSSILAWEIPWMEGFQPSKSSALSPPKVQQSHRVGYDLATEQGEKRGLIAITAHTETAFEGKFENYLAG